jgi:hypothetical protein
MRAHNFIFKRVSKEYKRFPHPGYSVTKKYWIQELYRIVCQITLILFRPSQI